jgi:transposase InsO family protein
VCIDDAFRIAFSLVMEDEKKGSTVAFLKAAVAYYAKLGVTVQRVMTDNGACYKSRAFARACKRLKLKHIRTKPYTPKTNGKAERFTKHHSASGLRARLPDFRPARSRAVALASSLQLALASWQPKIHAAYQQTCSSRNNLLRLHI